MGFAERWAAVVESVGCDLCHAPKGQPCTGVPDANTLGHGARLDTFCADAPYEARLFVHMDTLAETGLFPGTLFLTRVELDALNVAVVSAGGVPVGVVTGTWSKLGTDGGLVVVPVGAAQGVSVATVEVLGSAVRLPNACCVLPENLATRYGTPRVLVLRRCCGWDWVSTREEYMRTRMIMQPCVTFHTPSHNMECLEIPGWGAPARRKEREAAHAAAVGREWLTVAACLGARHV